MIARLVMAMTPIRHVRSNRISEGKANRKSCSQGQSGDRETYHAFHRPRVFAPAAGIGPSTGDTLQVGVGGWGTCARATEKLRE